MMTNSISNRLGKYEIIGEIGRGGFAAVYEAVDTTLDRTVALKALAPHLLWDPSFLERFQQEAKLAASLKHPNIVVIYEFGKLEGVVYITMEYLSDQNLAGLVREEGALAPSRILKIVSQVASALDYAHSKGLVHRDIKPSNIMIGAGDHVTVTDFGIAKAAAATALTTTGKIFGTPEYMSPEQSDVHWPGALQRGDAPWSDALSRRRAPTSALADQPSYLTGSRGHPAEGPGQGERKALSGSR
jgi:serine/threonine-protein kinase